MSAPNSQRGPDGWALYCEAFRALFGTEKKVELSAVALDEMADRLSGPADPSSLITYRIAVRLHNDTLEAAARVCEGFEGEVFDYDRCAAKIRALKTSAPSEAGAERWIDTKVRVPCDGDNVLGYWMPSVPGGAFDCDVVHYYSGRWHEPDDDEDEYRAPDFWMPLPAAPQSNATDRREG